MAEKLHFLVYHKTSMNYLSQSDWITEHRDFAKIFFEAGDAQSWIKENVPASLIHDYEVVVF